MLIFAWPRRTTEKGLNYLTGAMGQKLITWPVKHTVGNCIIVIYPQHPLASFCGNNHIALQYPWITPCTISISPLSLYLHVPPNINLLSLHLVIVLGANCPYFNYIINISWESTAYYVPSSAASLTEWDNSAVRHRAAKHRMWSI